MDRVSVLCGIVLSILITAGIASAGGEIQNHQGIFYDITGRVCGQNAWPLSTDGNLIIVTEAALIR